MNAEIVWPKREIYSGKTIETPIVLSQLISPKVLSQIPQDRIGAHLAWQYSRRISNPFVPLTTHNDFTNPSGFEPYFYNSGLNSEEVIQEIAKMGANFLYALDPQNNGWRGRMLSILGSGKIATRGEQAVDDYRLLKEANLIMATATNQLRTQLYFNKDAEDYRAETYALVTPYIPTLTHLTNQGTVIESYELPSVDRNSSLTPPNTDALQAFKLYEGWKFMSLMGGTVANPAVRQVFENDEI